MAMEDLKTLQDLVGEDDGEEYDYLNPFRVRGEEVPNAEWRSLVGSADNIWWFSDTNLEPQQNMISLKSEVDLALETGPSPCTQTLQCPGGYSESENQDELAMALFGDNQSENAPPKVSRRKQAMKTTKEELLLQPTVKKSRKVKETSKPKKEFLYTRNPEEAKSSEERKRLEKAFKMHQFHESKKNQLIHLRIQNDNLQIQNHTLQIENNNLHSVYSENQKLKEELSKMLKEKEDLKNQVAEFKLKAKESP